MTMRPATVLGLLAAALAPAAATAQGASARAAFVTRLGADTVAVERVTRQGREVRAEVLLRSPSTTLHVYRLQFDEAGRPVSLETTAHDPAAGPSSTPTARSILRFGADSLRLETLAGAQPEVVAIAGGHDVIPFIDMVHWPFELMLERARTATADSVVVPLLTGRRTTPFVVRRTAGNGYTVTHPLRGTMTVQSNERGELLRLDAGRTTRALLVTRVDDVDLPVLARAFAAPPAGGRALRPRRGERHAGPAPPSRWTTAAPPSAAARSSARSSPTARSGARAPTVPPTSPPIAR